MAAEAEPEAGGAGGGRPVAAGETVLARWGGDVWMACTVLEERAASGGRPRELYVHFAEQNRRLDRWVGEGELRRFASAEERARCLQRAAACPSPSSGPVAEPGRRMTRRSKRKLDDLKEEHGDHNDPAQARLEREHLERTKVRNLDSIVLGGDRVDVWYHSPYPEEVCRGRRLRVCERCFKYTRTARAMRRHAEGCSLAHPPGNEIYRKDGVSVFEVDGADSKVYAQCLCLLSKLFLEHKTLFYDVAAFWFYVVCEMTPDGRAMRPVGYFSKEKRSRTNNLACILTFPNHQRRGYGRFLIEVSYALARQLGRVGGPEKPLSDLGKVSYRSFWSKEVLMALRGRAAGAVSVQDIAEATCMAAADVVQTLQHLGLSRFVRGQNVVAATPRVVAQHLGEMAKRRREGAAEFDAAYLDWAPTDEALAGPEALLAGERGGGRRRKR